MTLGCEDRDVRTEYAMNCTRFPGIKLGRPACRRVDVIDVCRGDSCFAKCILDDRGEAFTLLATVETTCKADEFRVDLGSASPSSI